MKDWTCISAGLRTVLLTLVLFASPALAYDFEAGGVYYTVEGNKATVTSGEQLYSGNVTIPQTVTHNGTDYAVIAIGSKAFNECTQLTSVSIPNSITSIGSGAFWDCAALKSIAIPNTITKIEDYTFANCRSLEHVTIPSSVKEIGNGAFGCCSGLTQVEIPNSVTTIGHFAFEGCSGLTSITLPNLLENLGRCAFANCSGLTSFTIPSSVHIINYRLLANCFNISQITIPNTVTEIGTEAFYGCSGLKSIDLPNSILTISPSAFTGCAGLTSINLPDGLTAISNRLFSHCTGLKSVTIPPSVTTIGQGAFKECTGLTSLTIPPSVNQIDGWAFKNCTGLTEITIPELVTSIPFSAFAGCTALELITCLSSTPPEMDKDFSFERDVYTTATLHVPIGSIGRYRNDGAWGKFAKIEDENGSIRGDVNADRQVNVSDVNAVIECILSSGTANLAADVNYDGDVNISDINAIVGIILSPGGNIWSMRVWQTDGSSVPISLAGMPTVDCRNDSLIITTKNGSAYRFAMSHVTRLTYSKSASTANAPAHASLEALTGSTGADRQYMTIYLKGGVFSTCYLDNIDAMATSLVDENGAQREGLFYQRVDSRGGRRFYAVNDIDSITFGSPISQSSRPYAPITVSNISPETILPIIKQIDNGDRNFYYNCGLNDLRIAQAVHIVDMMWEHGAGDYTVEQYRQLMDRLCNVVMGELPFDEDAPIEYITDDNLDWYRSEHGNKVWSIVFGLMKHSNLYGLMLPYKKWGRFLDINPHKFIIMSKSQYTPESRENFEYYNNSTYDYIDYYHHENFLSVFGGSNIGIIAKKLYHQDVFGQDNVGEYDSQGILSHGVHDNILDSYLQVSQGFIQDNTANALSGGCKFHVGFHPDVMFTGLPFPYKMSNEYLWVDRSASASLATPFVASIMGLCFQMKADIKSVDELLAMLRSTALTDTLHYNDEIQTQQRINPGAYIKKYLMPLFLPVTVGDGPYVPLEKGFYKGVIFDIPGAEVKIDGLWITADAASSNDIKSRDPFTLEWRLNVPKLIAMGYGNGDTVTGRVIAVDDQCRGLDIEKEFSVTLINNN